MMETLPTWQIVFAVIAAAGFVGYCIYLMTRPFNPDPMQLEPRFWKGNLWERY
jgi:hypothetical protein